MTTVMLLTLIQIVAASARCGQDVLDLLARAKQGYIPTDQELADALAKANASAANWNKAAEEKSNG